MEQVILIKIAAAMVVGLIVIGISHIIKKRKKDEETDETNE